MKYKSDNNFRFIFVGQTVLFFSKFFFYLVPNFLMVPFFRNFKIFLGNHSPINETMQRVPSPFEKLSETNLYIRGLSADVSISSRTPPSGDPL